MKNYKKGLLALTVLSAMSLMAAEDSTIYVNTFEDEDGENMNKCSLREAIRASELNKAYGGCSAGEIRPTANNVIQLEAGTYKLEKELRPNVQVNILGKKPEDYGKIDVILNDYPALTAKKTIISGQNKTRIFNTTQDVKPELYLQDLELHDATTTGLGGALYLGGAATLSNVSIINSKATEGGAIYLDGTAAHTLTLNNGILQGNQATKGSVLSMTCEDNLLYTRRTIQINNSSLIQNGAQNNQTMLVFCGEPSIELTGNTIAKNIVNSQTGNLIEFSSVKNGQAVRLSTSAVLKMLSNTIVENTASSVLFYNKVGLKNFAYNILAFNQADRACRYAGTKVTEAQGLNFSLTKNALELKGAKQCELSKQVIDGTHESIDVSAVSMSSLLSGIQVPSEYTRFQWMYYPKNLSTATDFVDTGGTSCSVSDQRGIQRITDGTLILNPELRNTCDAGSTELMKLTAADIQDLSNPSVVELVDGYQKELDFFKKMLEDKETKAEHLAYYKQQISKYENLIKYTKSDQKYRTIFVDPFLLSLPDELDINGARHIQHLSAEKYTVTVTPLGMASNFEDVRADPSLKCEWNANLKQILMYRTDGSVTAAGDFAFCRYTLTLKGDTKKTSSGILKGRFNNIPSIAKDDEYKLVYGSSQRVSVNPLENDGDEGDGLISKTTTPNKPAFYVNRDGTSYPIRLVNIPDGLSVTADRQGPCPEEYSKETCYGGNLHIQVKNNFNPFNFKMTYNVFDADGKASEDATIKLQNTESTSTGESTSSGGGSVGLWSIFGLATLLMYRQRSQRRLKI